MESAVKRAIDLGLSGIAITDHECLSAHVEVNQYAKKIKEKEITQKQIEKLLKNKNKWKKQSTTIRIHY